MDCHGCSKVGCNIFIYDLIELQNKIIITFTFLIERERERVLLILSFIMYSYLFTVVMSCLNQYGWRVDARTSSQYHRGRIANLPARRIGIYDYEQTRLWFLSLKTSFQMMQIWSMNIFWNYISQILSNPPSRGIRKAFFSCSPMISRGRTLTHIVTNRKVAWPGGRVCVPVSQFKKGRGSPKRKG